MGMRPLTKAIKKATEVLRWSTIRDFGGGLNIIDNDLNLSSRFATKLDNLFRGPDGSLQIRWGTRLFSDTSSPVSGSILLAEPVATTITTTNLSTSVVLVLPFSGFFIRGQRIRLAGITATYGGIIAANLNGDRLITVVSGATITVTAGAAATSTSGPTAMTEGSFSVAANVVDSDVIGQHYFDDFIISAHANGELSRVNSLGQAEVIWNDDIAGLLPGAPSGWSAQTFASFATFGGPVSGGALAAAHLLVMNGIDKMIQVDFSVANTAYVQYVVDSATSNTASPIGRYVESLPEFLVVAGAPTSPSALLVSDQRNFSEWTLADGTASALPGQSTAFDLVHYVNVSNATIRGIRRFRDQLIVGFDEATVLLTVIANTTSGSADIIINEVIEKQGSLAHKSMVSIGDDILMADIVGVPSLEQALFTGGVRAERASELVDPDIQELFNALTVAQTEDRTFAVFNPLESQYMLFVPNAALTETVGFIYTKIDTLKVKAWAKFRDMNWRSGAISTLGRVFFSEGKKIFIYGSEHDPIYSDKEESGAESGANITFTWELPWADFDERAKVKIAKYLRLDTQGGATFQAKMFIDNILLTSTSADNPSLQMEFTGGSGGGYGFGPQPYGGGRRTSDERLWAWHSKFNIAKLKFDGATKKPLRFIAVSIGYSLGSIRR